MNLLNRNSNFENIYGIEKLSIKEVISKLEEHIMRIDHIGVNSLIYKILFFKLLKLKQGYTKPKEE